MPRKYVRKKPTKHQFALQEAHAKGRQEIIDLFGETCDGRVPLESFWNTLGIDPSRVRVHMVFTSAQQAKPRTGVMLCKVGQVDGNGHVLNVEDVAQIAEAYEIRGVSVMLNTNGELWSKETPCEIESENQEQSQPALSMRALSAVSKRGP